MSQSDDSGLKRRRSGGTPNGQTLIAQCDVRRQSRTELRASNLHWSTVTQLVSFPSISPLGQWLLRTELLRTELLALRTERERTANRTVHGSEPFGGSTMAATCNHRMLRARHQCRTGELANFWRLFSKASLAEFKPSASKNVLTTEPKQVYSFKSIKFPFVLHFWGGRCRLRLGPSGAWRASLKVLPLCFPKSSLPRRGVQ